MKVTKELHKLVDDLLHGFRLSEHKSSIGTGAYLIDGASNQNLMESLYGQNKSATLAEERDRHLSFVEVIPSNDLSAALLVAKSESSRRSKPRYHSVFFLKSKTGIWQIQNWHASN